MNRDLSKVREQSMQVSRDGALQAIGIVDATGLDTGFC